MPERVDVVAGFAQSAELFKVIALADQAMARKGLPGGQVAVGLNPPAADRDPASFPYARADFLEQRRLVLLHPLIVGG